MRARGNNKWKSLCVQVSHNILHLFCFLLIPEHGSILREKKFWHGNQLFKLFPCRYGLLQKEKKLLQDLGYIFVFLQKWIATRKKFKKLITVGHFYFFSVSRRIDPRSNMSRKQKRSWLLWPTCMPSVFHLLLPLALTILKKLFDTFLKILCFQKSFTKLLLYWKA